MITAPDLPSMDPRSQDSVVSDEMLEYWFEGTNFGCEPSADNRRQLIANGLLKHQAGWHNGYTMQRMIECHSLVNKRGNINKRGRLFLCEYFSNSNV